jgi:hypothetical protein
MNGTHAGHSLHLNGALQSLSDGASTGNPSGSLTTFIDIMAGASGDFAELIVYDAPTAATISQVDAYLLAKYGI